MDDVERDPADYTDEELGLDGVPFLEAERRLAEAGRLLEAGQTAKAIEELAIALSNTITEATEIMDGLHDRIAELEALVATS